MKITDAIWGWIVLAVIVLLTAGFVVLRVLGFIHWAWWWLVSPIWISVILLVILIMFGVWAEISLRMNER